MLQANPQLKVGENWDNQPMMEMILRYQPDILKRSPDPTPSWSLATPKTPELARWLMERGMDPNRRTWLGVTMLHRCAAKGDIPVAQVCLDFGADINAIETDSSSTPLGVAARLGKKEMVEWLLSKGADRRLPEDEPWALPLECARRKSRTDVIPLL